MGASASVLKDNIVLSLAERGLRPIPTYGDEGTIEHFIPPSFPLEVHITQEHMDRCRRTWKLIVTGQANGMAASQGRSGIVLFYDEFYFRLFQRAKIFRDIFPNMQKRGEILTKAFGYMLKLRGDNSLQENLAIARLGNDHHNFKFDKKVETTATKAVYASVVRPWHFPAYCEVALEVLMFWLGTDATVEVGEAWTVLITYVLQRLLGSFLIGNADMDEWYQNKGAEVQDAMSPTKKRTEPAAGASNGGTAKAAAPTGGATGGTAKAVNQGDGKWVPLHVRKEWAAKKAQEAKEAEAKAAKAEGGILKKTEGAPATVAADGQ